MDSRCIAAPRDVREKCVRNFVYRRSKPSVEAETYADSIDLHGYILWALGASGISSSYTPTRRDSLVVVVVIWLIKIAEA